MEWLTNLWEILSLMGKSKFHSGLTGWNLLFQSANTQLGKF